MRPLLLLVVVASAVPAQTLVHEWDFAAGPGEWQAVHSVAPLTVANGALVVKATGDDPYVHCSAGYCLDLDAQPGHFLRIRLRSQVEGSAQFFWAASTEGRDAGFVAGQEVGFAVAGDGEWHEIDVYPGWQGRIRRLRFDPPDREGGGTTEIARIGIYQWPASAQTGPDWDLTRDHGNWLPRGTTVMGFDEGLVLEGPTPAAETTLAFAPPERAWLTVEGWFGDPAAVVASWAVGRRRAMVRQPVGLGDRRVLLDLAAAGEPLPRQGEALRVQVLPDQPAPTLVRLTALHLGASPPGPAQLRVLRAAFDRAAAWLGETVTLQVTVLNAGSEPLPAGQVPLAGRLGVALPHPALAPGERQDLTVPATPAETGVVTVGIGPAGEQRRATLCVSAPPAEAPAAGATVTADTAALVGERIRLRAGRLAAGAYGPLLLEVRAGDAWRRVATLDAIGRVDAPGLGALPAAPAAVVDGALRFAQRPARNPNACEVAVTYRLAAPDRIAVETRFEAGADVRLGLLAGPWLRVGDGSFGSHKREALFPGIEYLGSDLGYEEASSSSRDIYPPRDLRVVPDPHHITIPLQAVTSPTGDLVALLWGFDAQGAGPAGLFASPNFVEDGSGRLARVVTRSGGNHLLGVFRCAEPTEVSGASLAPSTPLTLARGQAVTIESQLLARPDAQVLDAVKTWIEVYQPPPAGRAADLLDQTLRLSRTAYETVLWRDGRGWVSHISKDDARLNPAVAIHYRYLAKLLPEPGLRALAEQRLPVTDDLRLALHQGNVAQALRTEASADGALAGRDAQGEWTFQPTEATEPLGARGETNVGLMAAPLARILGAARAGADEALLAEGLRGLQQLRGFRVPRGAQVWEVPLHCPDILACAHAVNACRLGWQLTGDRQWLADAEYWAATALPFIYHWQHPRPDLAPMRGGSIPVLGASFFTNSWFGRLVQWNGLGVAGALRGLAEAGGDPSWARVAEDLAVSGQRQQITDPESKMVGLYPDYWNMRTGIPGYWMSPAPVLNRALEACGHTPDGAWLAFRMGGQLAAVASPTRLLDPRAGDQPLRSVVADVPAPATVTFTVDYDLGPVSFVALSGIGRPTAVSIGGRPATEGDLAQPASGWQYASDLPALILKIDHAAGPRVPVRLDGVAPAAGSAAQTAWTFTTDSGGWGANAHHVTVAAQGGVLRCEATGDDPYFSSPALRLDCSRLAGLKIRWRSTVAGGLHVFWATDQAGFGEAQSKASPPVPADGQLHEVTIPLAAQTAWRGRLTRLRLDPPGGAGALCEIERIELLPR